MLENPRLKNLFTLFVSVYVFISVGCFLWGQPKVPDMAYLRVLSDILVLAAFGYIFSSLKKPVPLKTEKVADSLRDLSRGRYNSRLEPSDFEQLSEIAQAFNELAGHLSDQHRVTLPPSLSSSKVQSKPANSSHSHHPELGPVEKFPKDMFEEDNEGEESELQAPENVIDLEEEFAGANAADQSLEEERTPDENNNQMAIPGFEEDNAVEIPNDLAKTLAEVDELYGIFKEAHQAKQKPVVSFDEFEQTLNATMNSLKNREDYESIRFEVVENKDEIAIRPRITRTK